MARHRGHEGVRPGGETLTAVLHRLASAGYARRLRADGRRMWCDSCESSFDPDELVVDVRVPVEAGPRSEAKVVYALRCSTCGARGTWVVPAAEAAEMEILLGLVHRDAGTGAPGGPAASPEPDQERAGEPA